MAERRLVRCNHPNHRGIPVGPASQVPQAFPPAPPPPPRRYPSQALDWGLADDPPARVATGRTPALKLVRMLVRQAAAVRMVQPTGVALPYPPSRPSRSVRSGWDEEWDFNEEAPSCGAGGGCGRRRGAAGEAP
eukprot:gene12371-biopygen1776